MTRPVLHYRSAHNKTENACGVPGGSHILAPELYTVQQLRTAYASVYDICKGCQHSMALRNDIIERELSRD